MQPVREYTEKGRTFVVFDKKEYAKLLNDLQDRIDAADADAAMARIRAGEEAFPHKLMMDLLAAREAGKSPIGVWRKYRKMTQKDLAKAIGVTSVYLGMMERCERDGSIDTLKKISAILRVDLEDLV